MLFWGYVLFVGLPVVGAVFLDVKMGQFFHQFFAGCVVSLADVEGQDFAAVSAVGVPKPPLALFAPPHESPHLVDEHTAELTLELRLFDTGKPLAEHKQDSQNADFQNIVDVADSAAPHGHLPDQLLVARVGTTIGVKILELLAAGLAQEILFALRLQPVLFNFVALAMGATHFDSYFAHNPKLLR